MNLTSALLALVFVAPAFAKAVVRVGDSCLYKYTSSTDPGSLESGTIRYTVAAIEGDKVTVQELAEDSNHKQSADSLTWSLAALEQNIQGVISNCTAVGGRVETVTVGGEVLQACRTRSSNSGGNYMSLDAPISPSTVVSQDQTAAVDHSWTVHSTLELVSHSRGAN